LKADEANDFINWLNVSDVHYLKKRQPYTSREIHLIGKLFCFSRIIEYSVFFFFLFLWNDFIIAPSGATRYFFLLNLIFYEPQESKHFPHVLLKVNNWSFKAQTHLSRYFRKLGSDFVLLTVFNNVYRCCYFRETFMSFVQWNDSVCCLLCYRSLYNSQQIV
jgi:hypothetical protein